MKKIIGKIVPTILVLVLVLAFLQELVTPKYMTNIIEGAMIEEYYDSDEREYFIKPVKDAEVE